ncbi:MAG: transporter family protein [Bacillales bacterium]|jgi:energy-coupling factor transport system ATP-binding protein|nr:transporter family protein [Bacillales bacterium]
MNIKLQVKGLSFKYYSSEINTLNDINFCVNEGEWVCILGENGSGKSTLAKLINGLYIANSGEIIINENLVVNDDTIWEVRKDVGMVFQNPDNQFVGVTVEDDVAFGLENIGIPYNDMHKIVRQSLKHVKMEGFEKSEPHKLSGGQKQRVAIAGAIATNPSILILDEATSMLDPIGREEVLNTIRKLNKTNKMTVISITHDLDEAINANRVIVLHQGQIAFDGLPTDLFEEHTLLELLALDFPQIIKLKNLLKVRNIKISKEVLELEGLVEELWELNSKT